MGLFQCGEGVHVGTLAIEVDGEDGFDPGFFMRLFMGMKGFFSGRCGEIEGDGVDIGQQGLRAATEDGADAGEEAEGCGDDGIAGADVGCGQGEPDGVCTAGAADGVGYGAGLSGGLFEAGDLGAEDESLRGADRLDGIEKFLSDDSKLTGKIKHLNGLRIVYKHRCHGISLQG